jgi:alpha-L-fucosidase 2
MKARNFIITLLLAGSIMPVGGENPALRMRYSSPATNWESEALPLGNGHIGGMIFGGVASDLILVNEKTLWSGGPGKNPAYNGGHLKTPAENHLTLQKVRNALQEKMTHFTENHAAEKDAAGGVTAHDYAPETGELKADIERLMGGKDDFGSYQQLSYIHIEGHADSLSGYTAYSRSLDVDSAVAETSYRMNGVNYLREYFVSHPDRVIVARFTADRPGVISHTFYLSSPQDSVHISAADGVVTLTGRPADQRVDGLRFAQQMMIIPSGGTLECGSNGRITVKNADAVLLISSAATNYRLSMDERFHYFSDEDPLSAVSEAVGAAAGKPYTQLRDRHVQDYRSLYARMNLSLEGAANADGKSVDELLADYGNGDGTPEENLYLELLYYQYGRYLLISSSRRGSLPANLQGSWAEGLNPPWGADYHTNINTQMNYWLAQQTNLSECHIPVIEYIRSLVPRGRLSAQHYYCRPDGGPVRGWVTHTENNIWGNTAPANWYTAFYFPAAAAWMCQDIWEYYRFNHDRPFLEEHYQTLLEAALFWVDILWLDARDGTLVANPSYSPEHGPYSLGASADQAIVWELFDMVIKASEALDRDTPEVREIREAQGRLSGPRIGLAGQLMEWKDELMLDITGNDHHRHANHLHWLHPGSRIVPGRSDADDLFADAMMVSLNTRGDGGTGWSKAWKINFWARLRDGNRSHKLLRELLKESTLPNLFDNHNLGDHLLFQIDGNFGATAGMTEMLVQSHGDCIEVLPSLPDVWGDGSFKGIRARGDFEIDAEWHEGKVTSLRITSGSGNRCAVKYNGKRAVFPTEAGESYDFEMQEE